ncbi:MAG: hypothetical protein M1820_000325 [Bogoriella megaspora]|nr:MAG: hypothetical protein M1820_000325 [Bogoriella megaspora]
MGLSDFFSDLYSSLTVQSVYAEEPSGNPEAEPPSGEMNDPSTVSGQHGGAHTAQQRGTAAVKGGASTKSPASGTDEESPEEAEVNKQDLKKGGDSGEPGHKPGSGGEGSGQVGPDRIFPDKGGDDDKEEGGEDEGGDEEEEEEEEEEDEPEDPLPKLQEDCANTRECAPLKHHYEECVERVTSQHEQHGKAKEDCVEEFFHLVHCSAQCAAPKLFKQLK